MPKIGYVRCRKVLGCRKVLMGGKQVKCPKSAMLDAERFWLGKTSPLSHFLADLYLFHVQTALHQISTGLLIWRNFHFIFFLLRISSKRHSSPPQRTCFVCVETSSWWSKHQPWRYRCNLLHKRFCMYFCHEMYYFSYLLIKKKNLHE